MNKFAQKAQNAQKAQGTMGLMNGREKIATEDLLAKYPNGITITSFDILNGQNGEHMICTFAEDTSRFYNGGKILTDMAKAWVEDYQSVEEANKDFMTCGGVKVKLSKGRTKKGNTIIEIEVLE